MIAVDHNPRMWFHRLLILYFEKIDLFSDCTVVPSILGLVRSACTSCEVSRNMSKIGVKVGVKVGVKAGVKVGVQVGVKVGVQVGLKVGVKLGVKVEVKAGVKGKSICILSYIDLHPPPQSHSFS